MQLTLLPQAPRPDTRLLLPLDLYDKIIVSFSGGKDSLALVLHLLECHVPKGKIQLWHQDVDGIETDKPFVDWPCTRSYVQAVAKHLDIPVFFQARLGGFKRELLKYHAKTSPVMFDRQDGRKSEAGGIKSKTSTRRKFPQASANLSVRWCSAVLKIDAFALAFNNEPRFKRGDYLVLTGERREESTNRSLYAEKEPHRCDSQRRRVDAWRAVIDWSEKQVWEIIERHHIAPHPAYRLGFPRVSCLTCIFGGPDQWASVRKVAPDRFAEIADYEREFSCTIKKGQTVVQMADRGAPYRETSDASLVALAMSENYPQDQVLTQEWKTPAGAFKKGGGPT